MIKYMLDTNICIYIIKKRPVQVIQKLQTMDIEQISISSITLSELEYGVSKSSNPDKNKLALAQFLAPVEIMDYNDLAAQHYGQIRASLESKGTPIGALDTFIAAHAKSLNYVLVSNNTREFARVEGLNVENWV